MFDPMQYVVIIIIGFTVLLFLCNIQWIRHNKKVTSFYERKLDDYQNKLRSCRKDLKAILIEISLEKDGISEIERKRNDIMTSKD